MTKQNKTPRYTPDFETQLQTRRPSAEQSQRLLQMKRKLMFCIDSTRPDVHLIKIGEREVLERPTLGAILSLSLKPIIIDEAGYCLFPTMEVDAEGGGSPC